MQKKLIIEKKDLDKTAIILVKDLNNIFFDTHSYIIVFNINDIEYFYATQTFCAYHIHY